MAKRKKRGRKTYSRPKKRYDLMGLPQNNGRASNGQKALKGVAYLATTLIAGGMLGAYAGKASGTVGALLTLASPFAPERFTPYMLATGAGMIVASPRMAPVPATTPTGVGALDAAKEFHAEGTARLKNFLSEISSKVGLQRQADKVLGLSGTYYGNVSYYNPADYTGMLSQSSLSGIDPLLSGLSDAANPLLAGTVGDSIAF